MKIALLYAGPYRGLPVIVENHKKTFNFDVDIYVSCFDHYLSDWKKSGFKVKEFYLTPKIDFYSTNWSKYRNDLPGQSGFWQFWNLKNLIESVPKKYDYYIKCRNDLVFNTELQLYCIKLQPNILYTPDQSFHLKEWDVDWWVNDEFYIGCLNTMNVIAKYCTDYYNIDRTKQENYRPNNESNLRVWLNENSIYIEKIYWFFYYKYHYGNNSPSGYGEKYQLESFL